MFFCNFDRKGQTLDLILTCSEYFYHSQHSFLFLFVTEMSFHKYHFVSSYYIWHKLVSYKAHTVISRCLNDNASPLPILIDNVHSLPDPGGVVNTNEAFCTVVQTRLADHRLLFSGEVDCRDKDPNAPAPPSCYVELKTSAEISTPKQRSNFHR